MSTTHVDAEIVSQPETWKQAVELLETVSGELPAPGERVAVVGCGTSWFIAQAYAVARESAGLGVTDAFAGSEYPISRKYDRIITLSRSGTTTEIVDLLRRIDSIPTLLITGVADSPAAAIADATIALEFADERSVVQTRFATSTLALLRAHTGEDIEALIGQAQAALDADISALVDADQVTFIGQGLAVGLAQEAALKTREAAQFWAEAYPALDYRHGPISIAQPGRLVWAIGTIPESLVADITSTGATYVNHGLDPLAELIVAQRFAVALAKGRGLDPDNPRSLTRSVILDA